MSSADGFTGLWIFGMFLVGTAAATVFFVRARRALRELETATGKLTELRTTPGDASAYGAADTFLAALPAFGRLWRSFKPCLVTPPLGAANTSIRITIHPHEFFTEKRCAAELCGEWRLGRLCGITALWAVVGVLVRVLPALGFLASSLAARDDMADALAAGAMALFDAALIGTASVVAGGSALVIAATFRRHLNRSLGLWHATVSRVFLYTNTLNTQYLQLWELQRQTGTLAAMNRRLPERDARADKAADIGTQALAGQQAARVDAAVAALGASLEGSCAVLAAKAEEVTAILVENIEMKKRHRMAVGRVVGADTKVKPRAASGGFDERQTYKTMTADPGDSLHMLGGFLDAAAVYTQTIDETRARLQRARQTELEVLRAAPAGDTEAMDEAVIGLQAEIEQACGDLVEQRRVLEEQWAQYLASVESAGGATSEDDHQFAAAYRDHVINFGAEIERTLLGYRARVNDAFDALPT